jgi:hypothetical protein
MDKLLLASLFVSSTNVTLSELFHESQLNTEQDYPTISRNSLPKHGMMTHPQCCGMSLRVLVMMFWRGP